MKFLQTEANFLDTCTMRIFTSGYYRAVLELRESTKERTAVAKVQCWQIDRRGRVNASVIHMVGVSMILVEYLWYYIGQHVTVLRLQVAVYCTITELLTVLMWTSLEHRYTSPV